MRATSLSSLPRVVEDVIVTFPAFGNLGGHAGGGRREARIHSLRGENRGLALDGFALLSLEASGGRHERRSDERRHGSGLVTCDEVSMSSLQNTVAKATKAP